MARVFKRDRSYWIDYNDVEGVRHRKKIGPSKRVANEVLNDILAKVSRAEFLGVVEESSIAFAEFAKTWRERVEQQIKPKTAKRWFGILKNHLKPAFKGTLRAITSAMVESYVAHRLEANANPQTVNRELSVLRHIIKRAVRWHYLARDPISKWPFSKESAFRRARFLTEEEIPKLLAACQDSRSRYLKAFVLVALNTGMRRGEILKLTRKSIDWHNRIATLKDTKNGDVAHIPLNDVAMEALRSLPTRIDGKLFPFKDDHAVSRAFHRAVERAGIKDFRLHDLRHTFASYHAMAGAQQRSLQGLLRHKDTRMTMRYSHLTEAHLRIAVEAMQLGATAAATPREAQDATG